MVVSTTQTVHENCMSYRRVRALGRPSSPFPGVLPLEDADFVSKNYVSSVSLVTFLSCRSAAPIVKIMGDRLKKGKSLMERNGDLLVREMVPDRRRFSRQ